MTIILETISLIHVFIIVFVIQGISAAFWEGHIFEKPGDWIERNHSTLWKPLVGCPICMSPWWGSAMQIVLWEYWNPLELIVVMGINAVIIRWSKD